MFEKVEIIRESPYATVKVKVAGEALYTFEGLSSLITDQSLALILPPMVERQRDKRERAAFRKIELAAQKERRAKREQIILEADINGQIVREEAKRHSHRQTAEEAIRWLGLDETLLEGIESQRRSE